LFRPFGLGDIDTEMLLMLFSLVALSCLAATVWLLSRDARERDPLLRAWHRLGRRYGKLGLARAPHEAALDWADRVHRARAGATRPCAPWACDSAGGGTGCVRGNPSNR
jgi:hypothetical protein